MVPVPTEVVLESQVLVEVLNMMMVQGHLGKALQGQILIVIGNIEESQ